MDCPGCGLPSADGLVICSFCGKLLPVPKSPPPAYGGLAMRSLAWMVDNLIGLVLVLLTGLLVIRPLFLWYFFPDGPPDLQTGAEAGFDLPSIWTATGNSGKAFVLFLLFMIGFLPSAVYFTLLESSRSQASLGKLAAGLQVTDIEGRRISLTRAFARFTGRWFSLMFWPLALISVATIVATKRHQALHDQLSGCVVTRKS